MVEVALAPEVRQEGDNGLIAPRVSGSAHRRAAVGFNPGKTLLENAAVEVSENGHAYEGLGWTRVPTPDRTTYLKTRARAKVTAPKRPSELRRRRRRDAEPLFPPCCVESTRCARLALPKSNRASRVARS
jgi:hypothetical protein